MFTIGSGKEEDKPKLYNDPFKKDSFKDAAIFIGYGSTNPISYSSQIRFIKENTEGQQKFQAKSLHDLLEKMESFMKSLD